MKVYKNNAGIKPLFHQAFVAIFAALLMLNIINAVKVKDFSNIKYYVMILIPLYFHLISRWNIVIQRDMMIFGLLVIKNTRKSI
jgi:hypothetical protein